MRKILKQVVGIDVSQKELVACVGRFNDDLTTDLYGSKVVKNNEQGHVALEKWVKKQT